MKELIRENLPLFKLLADKYKTYLNVPIDLKRIIYFITQFKDPEIAKKVVEILKEIDFLDSNKITHLLEVAYKKIDPAILHNPLICPLGSIQDSSALVCNKLIKKLFEDEKSSLNFVSELSNLGSSLNTNKPSCIVFFDDNITSGTQLEQFFHELISGETEPEIVRNKLNSEQIIQLQKVPIRLCFAIKLDSGCDEKIQAIRDRYNLNIELLYGKADLNNHLDYGSSVFSSMEENERVKKAIMDISVQLYQNKLWSKETLYSRLTGYGNLGKVTVFYHNIPKSLIPIFWKFGTYNSYPWIPLFPESKEVEAMNNSGVEMDNLKLDMIDLWISEDMDRRTPKLVHGILFEGDMQDNIEIPIPTEQIFRELYLRNIKDMCVKAEPDSKKNNINAFSSYFPGINSPLINSNHSSDYYPKYLEAIENYNSELAIYRNWVIEYIKQYISSGTLKFCIKNIGKIAATNVKVEFSFNSGELIIINFSDIPKPNCTIEKPILDEYRPGSFKITSSIHDFSLSGMISKKREPYELGIDYSKKWTWKRIGHNDYEVVELDLHRIDSSSHHFKVIYDLNFDEESETITNTLNISFIPSEDWKATTEFDKEVKRIIKNLTEKF